MSPLLICYGTQTGTTESLAHDVHQALERQGFAAELYDLADAWPELWLDYPALLLLTSTWIEGRMPNSAVDFYQALEAIGPDLSHLRFALLAVGDRAYAPHVNHAAWRFRDTLNALGATQVGAPLAFEGGPVSVHPEEAIAWALRLVPALCNEHG